MPGKYLMKPAIAACIALFFIWTDVPAQFSNTYYHMYMVPQANQLNPAFQPGCNGYLGLPFLSPLRFGLESNSVTFGDIFEWDPSTKKYNIFLHPQGNRQRFVDALKPLNVIRTELLSSFLSTGWRKDQLFFTLDFSERIIQRYSFPRDFAEFILNGNLYKDNFNFSDLSGNLTHLHVLAMGASYNHDDEMQFGLRAKLLLGVANVTTGSPDISLRTSMDEWRINSDLRIDASIPYLESLPVDNEGYLDTDSLENTDSDLIFGFPDEIPAGLFSGDGLGVIGGLKNPGFAVDLGFRYVPVENLSVSASLIDLGFIRWRNYAYNFLQDLDYSFKGLEFKIEDEYDPGEELWDSLKNDLKVKVSQDPYTTMMTGRVYLGVAYDLAERVRFGGVFRTRIYDYKLYNQFTVSANVRPLSFFSASVSYSVYGNSYMNLGLGLSMRLGPFNMYFITDQAPSAYFWPEEFASLNFRLGLNIAWGCRAIPKAMKDRPLID
jgi:hypothetical protein